ncbi:MAG: hypothetical protein ACIAXF_00870 [Phycisphaerales bacterium JB063]
MKPTVAVIHSNRYSTDPPGVPYEDTPPGQDFAQDLLTNLQQQGATSRSPIVTDDHYDNNFWELALSWGTEGYWVCVEAGCDDADPPTWYVRIEKRRGCLMSFFGRLENLTKVSNSFLKAVESHLMTIADSRGVKWITLIEYGDSF